MFITPGDARGANQAITEGLLSGVAGLTTDQGSDEGKAEEKYTARDCLKPDSVGENTPTVAPRIRSPTPPPSQSQAILSEN